MNEMKAARQQQQARASLPLHAMEMQMLRWGIGVKCLHHALNEVIRQRMGVAPTAAKMREVRMINEILSSQAHSELSNLSRVHQ